MTEFSPWVTPLNHRTVEPLYGNQKIEYEDFPCTVDVVGPLLYTLDFLQKSGTGNGEKGTVGKNGDKKCYK